MFDHEAVDLVQLLRSKADRALQRLGFESVPQTASNVGQRHYGLCAEEPRVSSAIRTNSNRPAR